MGGGGGGGGKGSAPAPDTSASDAMAKQNAAQQAKLDAQQLKQQQETAARIAARSRGGTRVLMNSFTPAPDPSTPAPTQSTLGPTAQV